MSVIAKVKSKYDLDVVIRVPLIPTANATVENVTDIVRFVADELRLPDIEFLPYHSYGSSKYVAIDREYSLRDIKPPAQEFVDQCDEIARQAGLTPLHF